MLVFPKSLKDALSSSHSRPVVVAEIVFFGGKHGQEGVHDVYFGTTDISNIQGFPYPDRYSPTLDIESISGYSQKLDLRNGVSSIGDVSVDIIDVGNFFTALIGSAHNLNEGLRRQIFQIYILEHGAPWSDRVKKRTLRIRSVKRNAEASSYKILARDIQSQMDKKIFQPKKAKTTQAITTADTLIHVFDTSELIPVYQPYGLNTVFIKVGDEFIEAELASTTTLLVVANGRGLFGTVPSVHDAGADCVEVCVLRGSPTEIALKVLTSTGLGTNGPYDVYPAHWGCGFDYLLDVSLQEWERVGQEVFGSTVAQFFSGSQDEHIPKPVKAKFFIEKRLLQKSGLFSAVHGDGSYGVRVYSDISNIARDNCDHWVTDLDIISSSGLDFGLDNIVNDVVVRYNESPAQSGKFLSSVRFLNAVSIKENGETEQLEVKAYGVVATKDNIDRLFRISHANFSQLAMPSLAFQLKLMPRMASVEVGDTMRVTMKNQIDPFTGLDFDRGMQIHSVSEPKDGTVVVDVVAAYRKSATWYGGVGVLETLVASPNDAYIQPNSGGKVTLTGYDGLGNEMQMSSVVWVVSDGLTVTQNQLDAFYSGDIMDSLGISRIGTAYAVVGGVKSNAIQIHIETFSTNPIAVVKVSPTVASVPFATQKAFVSQAFDLAGLPVSSQLGFSFSSDDVSVVDNGTVHPAYAHALLSGNVYGSTLVHVTEIASGVQAPPVHFSVSPEPVRTYSPAAVDSSAFVVGVNIDAWGGVGDYVLTEGVYHVTGDLIIPFGVTLTIHGTVGLYVDGSLIVNGRIDGVGNGASLTSQNGYFSNAQSGFNGTATFHTDGGLFGGGQAYDNPSINPLTGSKSDFSVLPAISPVVASRNAATGAIASFFPIFSNLKGGKGGAGASWASPRSDGGNGGAGFYVCARWVQITQGVVDLSGNSGSAVAYYFYGNSVGIVSETTGAGAAGNGGTFAAFAEKDSRGMPSFAVDRTRIINGNAGKILDVLG